MKNNRITIYYRLSIFLLFISITYIANAQQYTLTDADVVVSEGSIQSCSYDFTIKDIIIPPILDGQNVTGIGLKDSDHGVFEDKGITSVMFPSTLEFIGNESFRYNPISTIDLSSCIKLNYIGDLAFHRVPIDSLDLTSCNSLSYIGRNAFQENKFTHLDLSNSTNLEYIGDLAFAYTKLESIIFKNCSSLTYIGSGAFHSNITTDLDLSDCTDLRTIGTGAFIAGALVNVNFNGCSNLEVIDHSAFRSNNIDSVNFSGCAALSYLGSEAFKGNNLDSIDLSECVTLTSIGSSAFNQNNMNSFILPEPELVEFQGWKDGNRMNYDPHTEVNDLSISYHAIVPYTFTEMDVEVVDGFITKYVNSPYTYITIPNMLDDQMIIGVIESVFLNKGIYGLNLPDNIEIIEKNAFKGNEIDTLSIDNCTELEFIGDGAFNGSRIRNLDLSNSVNLSFIGNFSFYNNKITSLDLSYCTKLETVGESAFWNNNIVDLNLSNLANLTSIEMSAFAGNLISEIDLEDCSSLVYIGKYAFYNDSLTQFNLPTPNISGKVFNYWKDEQGNTYEGGDLALDFETSYTAELNTTTKIEENLTMQFKVFPNPSSDYIIVNQLDSFIIERIELYSLRGQKILIKNNSNNSNIVKVNIQHLEDGFYILKSFIAGNKELVTQIIKF